MRRDMNLIKEILLNIENDLIKANIDGYGEQDILNHKGLLIDSGFIEGKIYYDTESSKRIVGNVIIRDLTWQGHNLIDTLKNDSKFNMLKDLGKNLSLEGLKIALNNAITSSM